MKGSEKSKRPHYGGGRRRTGTLVRSPSTGMYSWRHFDDDGNRVTEPLGTDVERKALAERDRRLAGGEAPLEPTSKETFAEAAKRTHDGRAGRGVKGTKDEWARLKAYVFPKIGPMFVASIKFRHVTSVLDSVQDLGKSKQTCQHVKQAIANVFAMLMREGAIEINPAKDADLPAYTKVTKKHRAVCTDDELRKYLDWQNPDKRHAGPVFERQIMSVVSYCFGGVRTGDLHGMKWRHVNPPDFEWGFALRQKTAKPQPIVIDAKLRPWLRAWYEHLPEHQRGADMPVFPTWRAGRSGSEAGAHKGKSSHAKALRTDLRRAFGIDAPTITTTVRKNQRPLTVVTWIKDARPMTPREAELLDGTELTEPVDFHSWRRTFRQAMSRAKVDAATARELGGWASAEVAAGYNRNPDHMLEIPTEALPDLKISQKRQLPE